jgi:hypothetical protein
MSRPPNNITGKVYGRLTAIKYAGDHKYLFRCSCGKEKIIRSSNVTRTDGHRTVKSCGCLLAEYPGYNRKHGMSSTRFYNIWASINDRCYGINSHKYPIYGGKGITSTWKDNFIQFKNDMYESYLSHVRKYGERNTTIDRLDGNKNYNKSNCRWATYKVQNNNRPGYNLNGQYVPTNNYGPIPLETGALNGR